MEKMDWKVPFVWGCAFSLAAGAFGNYLANKKKIDFANDYPIVLETQEFMEEAGGPEIKASEKDQINAYLSLYGDKYTFAEDGENVDSEEFVTKLVNESPTAFGCGFTIEFHGEDQLFFDDIEPDMPAAKAGIQSGDQILTIDGETVSGYPSAKGLAGKEGETLTLTLARGGEQFDVSFDRVSDKSAAAGVFSEMYGDTLYIRYSSFLTGGIEEVKSLIETSDFDSLILDLRENSGGNTSMAVSLADLFVPSGEKVFLHANTGSTISLETVAEPLCTVPTVLLVNENTASAAEIFTALMKQYSDTTLVGTTTFGKGIYQEYGVLRGCSVRYTAGYYTVGDWKCYHGYGIEPDVEVKMETGLIGTELDSQLEKALEIIG